MKFFFVEAAAVKRERAMAHDRGRKDSNLDRAESREQRTETVKRNKGKK